MKYIYIVILFIPFFSFAQSESERHNTSRTDAWISCEMTANPNNTRPNSHWFMMNLGHRYALGTSTIWNYNDPAHLDYGVSRVAIDLSDDGLIWDNFGEFDLTQAQSSGFYYGDEGPNFENIEAQYVLFTVLETYGGNCAGLSEIKINVGEPVSSDEDFTLITDCKVSPNPFTDYVILSGDLVNRNNTEISITDVQGKLVYTNTLELAILEDYRIELPNLSPGTYSLELRNDLNTCASKLIKP